VVNTVSETAVAIRDGFEIRRAAAEKRIPCFTSLDTARAAVESLLMGTGSYNIKRTDGYLDGP
jgi:carbamoyl-phosphate synthase large subunit